MKLFRQTKAEKIHCQKNSPIKIAKGNSSGRTKGCQMETPMCTDIKSAGNCK